MRRHARPVLASFAFAVSALAPVPAHAVFLVVNKTADTNDGVCDADCSFREAVAVANATPGEDVITVPAGTFPLSLGIVLVTEAVTINGAGRAATILDGGDAQPVLAALLVPGLVRIDSLRIQNGRSEDLFQTFEVAGGFSSAFGVAQLTNVDVLSSAALVGKGGGIHVGGGSDTTLEGVVVSGNASAVGGGGIHVGAASSEAESANAFLFVVASNVNSNQAPFGGGISVTDGDVFVTGSIVEDNVATQGGGGVLLGNDLPRTRFEMRSSIVRDNDAETGGGFLLANLGGPSSVVAVYDSSVSGNDAVNGGGVAIGTSTGVDNAASILFQRVLFFDNDATSAGGAINVQDGTAVVASSTVSNSDAVTGGGVVAVGGTLELRQVTLADNGTGTGNGTAITTAGGVVRVLGSIVRGDCDVLGGGGGITSFGGNREQPASSCNFTGTGDQTGIGDLLLGPLTGNGGPTSTYALQSGSPALDTALPPTLCPPADQRGFERADGACDAGAFELGGASPAIALDDFDAGALGPAWAAASTL